MTVQDHTCVGGLEVTPGEYYDMFILLLGFFPAPASGCSEIKDTGLSRSSEGTKDIPFSSGDRSS